jgi:ribulose-phosphate 3-epimerase
MAGIEIVPAILAKNKGDFEKKLSAVAPFVRRVQIDIMDGKFVPNKTLGLGDFPPIPSSLVVEYHLMVENPLEYVKKIGNRGAIYCLHLESLVGASSKGGMGKLEGKEAARAVKNVISKVKKMGGRVALAISPDTPAEDVLPYLAEIEYVLVMTVYPGFSGQGYLARMEDKMRLLSSAGGIVEVDGGIDIGTAKSAASAGATLLGAASGIFAKPDVGKAIDELKKDAES